MRPQPSDFPFPPHFTLQSSRNITAHQNSKGFPTFSRKKKIQSPRDKEYAIRRGKAY